MNTTVSTDLQTVLVWLSGVGAPVLVGYLLAFMAERAGWWHKLPSEVKFIVPLLVSVAISLAATALLAHPEIIAQYQNIFALVMMSILTYLSTQKGHAENKKPSSEPDQELEQTPR